ncbi:MAG: ProQ/FinO family protein [Candidatus Contendobacter sp.]|nr:ProQ/FinO family protein [Candidatus Contendobacter sp.]
MSYDVNPILDRLCQAFPACFDRSTPKPLKIGLGEELLALAGVHPALADLTRTQIRRTIKFYTSFPTYRKALAKGGPRYDLEGQAVGEVTPEQQTFAKTPRPRRAVAQKSTPSAGAEPARISPPDLTVLLPELIAMAIPGKLDVTLKINQLPQVKSTPTQTVLFAVQADGRTIVVELKNKAWNTLRTAATTYPQWVASIGGKLGEAIEGGFRLEHPVVQVFERKAKA